MSVTVQVYKAELCGSSSQSLLALLVVDLQRPRLNL